MGNLTVFGQSELFNVINKSLDLYEFTPHYTVDVNYSMHKFDGDKLKKDEEYIMELIKNGKTTKLSVLGGEMYSYDSCLVTVFEKKKEILVRDNEGLPLFTSSIDYLKSYKEKYNVFKVSEDSSKMTLKLLPKGDVKKSNEIIYQEILLTISKNNNQLLKQQLLINQGVDSVTLTSKKIKMLRSMMEISFSKIDETETCLPDKSDFFKEDSLGKLSPTRLYSTYTVNDKRKKTKNI